MLDICLHYANLSSVFDVKVPISGCHSSTLEEWVASFDDTRSFDLPSLIAF